jgi:hypothetical protein
MLQLRGKKLSPELEQWVRSNLGAKYANHLLDLRNSFDHLPENLRQEVEDLRRGGSRG